MENNTHFSREQESFLNGVPEIEMVNKGDKTEMAINRDSLPAHCQYALVKAAVNTFNALEGIAVCEKQQEALKQALRIYLTTTKKPIDLDSTWKRLAIASLGTLVCFMVFWVGMRYAVQAGSELAVAGNLIAVGVVAAIAGLFTIIGLAELTQCLANRDMNTVKSAKRLKDLIQEIEPVIEQEVQRESQTSSAANDAKHEVRSEEEVSSDDCSKRSSGFFFPAAKPMLEENETVQQTGDDDKCGLSFSVPF